MDKFRRNPLLWVPTLYLAMGIPFNVIMSGTAANMYKSLGYSNAEITIALGSIGVAWSLKPLWAAFLDMYRTKKFFVLLMELTLAALFVGVAMSIPTSGFFQVSLALLWVAAFASSTQDICADGVYLTSLDKPAQAKYAGVQGMFWVSGKVLATGGFIFAMTSLQAKLGWSEHRMWQGVMCACAGAMLLLFAWHYWYLPTGSVTERPKSFGAVFDDFRHTAVTFFHKRAFWGMMAFVCLYRLGEGLILMEGQLFLRSATAEGGLGLSAGQVSQIDAIFGTVASICGGLLGGWFAGKMGLSRSLWILGLCLNVPHLTYVALSQVAADGQGASYGFIASMVSIEKFGYGFGMVGNMIYMMQQLAPGRRTMTHYAFATALMNLMLVPTNMISGPLAELLGFSTFFIVVMFASLPSIWAAFKAPFPLKAEEEKLASDAAGNGHEVITVDDPTRLSPGELTVQAIAGRASMFAILHVLALLVLDAMVLGWLHGNMHGTAPGFVAKGFLGIGGLIPGITANAGQIFYGVLIGCALLKAWLAWKCVRIARHAIDEAAAHGETNYRGNARGAIAATVVCIALGVVVLYFGAKMVP
jgi:PAT family beta-lactamase induction signal transducer AmpG